MAPSEPRESPNPEALSAVARQLRAIPKPLLADPSNPEVLDLIIECVRTTYELGNLYLYSLSARREAAHRGSIVELMRWCREVTRLQAMLPRDLQRDAELQL
jgi:hypothetical protein